MAVVGDGVAVQAIFSSAPKNDAKLLGFLNTVEVHDRPKALMA